ncbi:hypothetical protein GCM10010260_38420 [Streptomyces filipinensis]|uniref:Uncharacterized protein n=1 Tax=Streptomyces filipinensis TaxID=66887 RepID=A0A918IBI4_9ACTN|nr:hypothetical protein GCM10010260_38420 [Streptomyces filipinensis]
MEEARRKMTTESGRCTPDSHTAVPRAAASLPHSVRGPLGGHGRGPGRRAAPGGEAAATLLARDDLTVGARLPTPRGGPRLASRRCRRGPRDGTAVPLRMAVSLA